MLHRAYSILTIKQFDDDERVIEGVATTPTPDRLGDIVEPDGAEYSLPLPLLMGHDSRAPIGHVTNAKVTKNGIDVKARLVKVDEPNSLKERLDEAWALLKSRLVRGLSIGFKSIESTRIEDTFSYRFVKWQWLELSAVVIPANAEAMVEMVRGIDHFAADQQAVLMQKALARLNDSAIVTNGTIPPAAIGNGSGGASSPGASGKTETVNLKRVRNRDGTFRAYSKL